MKAAKCIEASILIGVGATLVLIIWVKLRSTEPQPTSVGVPTIFGEDESFVYDHLDPELKEINFPSVRGQGEKVPKNEVRPSQKTISVYEFGQKLHSKFTELEPEKNLVFSPLSFTSLLTMTAFGFKGDTEAQLRNVTGIQRSWQDEASFLMENLPGLEESGAKISSKIYVNQGLSLKPEYTNTLSSELNTEAEKINFADSATAASSINAWFSSATDGKVENIVAEDSFNDTASLVLLNAIYFKGSWKVAFKLSSTRKATFKVSLNKDVQVDMMFLNDEIEDPNGFLSTAYAPGLYKAVQLPYEGDRLSMLIFVPHKSKTVSDVQNKLGNTSIRALLKSFEVALGGGGLYVPKFKIESNVPAKKALVQIGITDIFSLSTADLSGIAGDKGDLHVSNVVHKAVIEVNEDGIEAAGATEMESGSIIRPSSASPAFKVDRPFVFMIVDKPTESVVFSGTCYDPTSTSR